MHLVTAAVLTDFQRICDVSYLLFSSYLGVTLINPVTIHQTWIQDLLLQDQDQDKDLLIQDQDQDQDCEIPRPRPRPRLVKTGLET